MFGHHLVIGDDVDACGVQPNADPLSGPFPRHRIAVALHADQAGARHLGLAFDIAVKHRGHGHHLGLFLDEHFGNAEMLVLGVVDFTP